MDPARAIYLANMREFDRKKRERRRRRKGDVPVSAESTRSKGNERPTFADRSIPPGDRE